MDPSVIRMVGCTRPCADGVRPRAPLPPGAGVPGAPRARSRTSVGAAALGRIGDRGHVRGRARHPAVPDVLSYRCGRQRAAAGVPAHLLERDGDVLRPRGGPAHAPDGVRAGARVRAGRRGGGPAGRGRDALLHVFARRHRRRARRPRHLLGARPPARADRRAAGCRDTGGVRAQSRLRGGPARARRLHRARRAGAGTGPVRGHDRGRGGGGRVALARAARRPAAGADRGHPACAPRRLRGRSGRRGARARGRRRRVRPARSRRRCLHGVRRSRDDLDS